MAKSSFKDLLSKIDGAVRFDSNPHADVLRTPSPSTNFTFGNGWGLPAGFSLGLYGPQKGGKSLISNAFIGQLHRDNPEACAIKFNTEQREDLQMTPRQMQVWGVDMDRYEAFDTNDPVNIFDGITNVIPEVCEKGKPVKLVIIDSINQIQGRRGAGDDTIETQQRGDHALTIQEGLKRILPIQRKYKFGVILCCHVRAEQDPLKQKRNGPTRIAASFGVLHHCEYLMYVEKNQNSDARSDLLGNEFKNVELRDIRADDKYGEQTGHKIRVIMKDSTAGPKNRAAEFTLDYNKGIVNVHEEMFLLGINRGIIERPNDRTYAFRDKKWNGKPAILQAIKENPELQADILKELKTRDLAGYYNEDVPSSLSLEESA